VLISVTEIGDDFIEFLQKLAPENIAISFNPIKQLMFRGVEAKPGGLEDESSIKHIIPAVEKTWCP